MTLPEHSDPVVIPKGTTVFSTAPNWPNEGKPSGRRLTLRFYRRENYGDPDYDRLTWAGSGGYWRWARLSDIEKAAA